MNGKKLKPLLYKTHADSNTCQNQCSIFKQKVLPLHHFTINSLIKKIWTSFVTVT